MYKISNKKYCFLTILAWELPLKWSQILNCMNSASNFNRYHSSLNLGKELKRMIVTWTRIRICFKKAKNTKTKNNLTKLNIISLSYHNLTNCTFLNVSPWWWINILIVLKGDLIIKNSREKCLIVWSSVQSPVHGMPDWDVSPPRWNYPSAVGGRHRIDAADLRQRLRQLHHHRQRALLADGLQECWWSNKNGNVALQGSHLCTFHGQVSFI